MKTFGIRIFLTFVLLVILELFVINIASLLPFLAANKANVSQAPSMDFIIQNVLHPISQSNSLIADKNPLFILGSAAVGLAIYVAFFMKGSKGKYELADKYGVHSSSRFAHKHEIFKQGETVAVAPKQFIKDIEASILVSEGEKAN
ncbi:hypothetical protein CON13_25235 [Bacillus cereus]|uniref:hypothetical protein n=1 Tax=Bacillus cereus TaxID=1396 RepID=UPI000BEC18AF|nr:hypothetical protein [Bacillus cereus]PED29436.1 hypothetical protein CON13_25235 [Bacillus cereus]PEE50292.1 hypothetical protein COM80_26055 [Bacillus cereus]PFL96683.1 hypothetical protein COJ35_08610 [Bacillus cereus]PFV66755.1 hypothetical protein COL16_23850 [Bacillus cereus]PGS40010.1 hypothetical protein COC56_01070 [Bacillus cereus]